MLSAMRVILFALALLFSYSSAQFMSSGGAEDIEPFDSWMPNGGKCTQVGNGVFLCKNLPKQDLARIRNGSCMSTGPDYHSCAAGAEPFSSMDCVPSGPGVYRCGKKERLVDKFFCLEAWEGVHMCKEEKPLAILPKVPGALGG